MYEKLIDINRSIIDNIIDLRESQISAIHSNNLEIVDLLEEKICSLVRIYRSNDELIKELGLVPEKNPDIVNPIITPVTPSITPVNPLKPPYEITC